MKKSLLLFITSLILSTVTFASFPVAEQTIIDSCDNIIFKSGDEISAKIIEITPDLIKYKRCDNLEGPLISVKISDVILVRYYNGVEELLIQEFQSKSKGIGTAILSLTTGIIGILMPVGVISYLLGAISIVSGLTGLNKKHYGLSVAGFVLGLASIVLTLSII